MTRLAAKEFIQSINSPVLQEEDRQDREKDEIKTHKLNREGGPKRKVDL